MALLVDDSKATNFFNKTVLQRTGQVEEVFIAENGKEALAYLEEGNIPEIIFLDINMPIMSGWEFLLAYQQLGKAWQSSVIILMLGASLSESEMIRARSFSQVKGFEEKMLTKTIVSSIIDKNIESAIYNKETIDFNS